MKQKEICRVLRQERINTSEPSDVGIYSLWLETKDIARKVSSIISLICLS